MWSRLCPMGSTASAIQACLPPIRTQLLRGWRAGPVDSKASAPGGGTFAPLTGLLLPSLPEPCPTRPTLLPIAQARPTQKGREGCQPACLLRPSVNPTGHFITITHDLKSQSGEHLLASSLIPRVCETPLSSGCLSPKPRCQLRVTVILVVALSKSSLEDMFDFGEGERNTDLLPPVRTLQGPNL